MIGSLVSAVEAGSNSKRAFRQEFEGPVVGFGPLVSEVRVEETDFDKGRAVPIGRIDEVKVEEESTIIEVEVEKPVIEVPIISVEELEETTARIKPRRGKFQIGDVNRDRIINIKDAELIHQYLKGKIKLNKKQLKLADVNQDGKVTLNDWRILAFYHAGFFGDVNGDGYYNAGDALLIEQSLHGLRKLTIPQMRVADVNLDSDVGVRDVNLLLAYSVDKRGDVNGDKVRNLDDVRLVKMYIFGEYKFSNIQLVLADVNRDGKIDAADLLTV
jgi:hypothetical protein